MFVRGRTQVAQTYVDNLHLVSIQVEPLLILGPAPKVKKSLLEGDGCRDLSKIAQARFSYFCIGMCQQECTFIQTLNSLIP